MNLTELKDALKAGTVKDIKNTRQNRFTHILVLRETTSPARFTTDGETTNTTSAVVGDREKATLNINVAELFTRKQPGAERRQGKAIQQEHLSHIDECKNDSIDPSEMSECSVESVLFGCAAGDGNIAQRSRVYYNSAYSLRTADTVIQQNRQTAAGDSTRSNATENQGIWTQDFIQPNTFFPSVITLDSATPEEVLFVLSVIQRTGRYGANTTRAGRVHNHILGAYCGTQDGPANYELNGQILAELAGENYTENDLDELVNGPILPRPDVRNAMVSAYETLTDRRYKDFLNIPRNELKESLKALSDDGVVANILEEQYENVDAYLTEFNSQ